VSRLFADNIFRMRDTETATKFKLAYFDEVKKSEKVMIIGHRAGVNYITIYHD
jgi:hypothetical protein